MTYPQEAYARGEDAAKASASWIVDGNTPADDARHALAQMREGDPAMDQWMPRRPALSGEFADDPTPRSLAQEITGEDDPAPEVVEQIADAFEEAVSDHFEAACERELMRFVGDIPECPDDDDDEITGGDDAR